MDYRRPGARRVDEGHTSRVLDGGDPRTPIAWQHRDTAVNYNNENPRTPNSNRYRYPPGTGPTTPSISSRRDRGHSADRYSNRSRGNKSRYGAAYSGPRSQPSPSSTDGTTEETTETDSQPPPERERSDYNGPVMQGYPVMVGYPMFSPSLPMMVPGTGSIRSVQSVPMLSPPSHTWDGEPCPVHHHHHQQPMVPLAALYGMGGPNMGYGHPMGFGPASVPASVISGATTVRRARSVAEISLGGRYNQQHPQGHEMDERKSFHASMMSLGPNMIMPQNMRTGRVVRSETGAASHLPTREHPKKISPLPGKDLEKQVGFACCTGHFVVLWIILGIITFGVLLGIVLKFTIS